MLVEVPVNEAVEVVVGDPGAVLVRVIVLVLVGVREITDVFVLV